MLRWTMCWAPRYLSRPPLWISQQVPILQWQRPVCRLWLWICPSRPLPYVADQLPELLISFESSRPEVIPDPAILLQLALDWAQGDGSADRVQYYSADEVAPEVAPKKRAVLRLTKTDAQLAAQASTLGGGAPSVAKPAQPKSRVTTASLASQLQTSTASLPALMKSVEDVAARQEAMERQLAAGPSAPPSQALGLGAKPKHGVQSLALLGPPPRTAKAQPVAAGHCCCAPCSRAARLPITTPAWTSAFLFRRACMVVLSGLTFLPAGLLTILLRAESP